jgi:hypothetical protein
MLLGLFGKYFWSINSKENRLAGNVSVSVLFCFGMRRLKVLLPFHGNWPEPEFDFE